MKLQHERCCCCTLYGDVALCLLAVPEEQQLQGTPTSASLTMPCLILWHGPRKLCSMSVCPASCCKTSLALLPQMHTEAMQAAKGCALLTEPVSAAICLSQCRLKMHIVPHLDTHYVPECGLCNAWPMIRRAMC